MTTKLTMFEKIWRRHVVFERDDGYALLYVDRHMAHEASFHAFAKLRERGLHVARPELTLATADHYAPTNTRRMYEIKNAEIRGMLTGLDHNGAEFGVRVFDMNDPGHGIVHVIGPEQGFTLPGTLLVCADSHTATHGALGAFAFGIGQSEVAHVLATQTLWQTRPKTFRIRVEGQLAKGVTAKDVILFIIARIETAGATGYVIEYAGEVIRNFGIEERLTVCNMSIEAGARAGMIAPDQTTFDYLRGRPMAPQGAGFEAATTFWRTLPSDEGAVFDREIVLDGAEIAPMVTWGTSPQMASPISGVVPYPSDLSDPDLAEAMNQALNYMALQPGTRLTDIPIDQVFIGSCTNGRIEDLRAAAEVARTGHAVVPTLVSPGSHLVKVQAEQEGLDKILIEAGFTWGESSCSMCVAINGDVVQPGMRCASTTNRNFRGRQGRGARTHLMSPRMAAAAALAGHLVDIREKDRP